MSTKSFIASSEQHAFEAHSEHGVDASAATGCGMDSVCVKGREREQLALPDPAIARVQSNSLDFHTDVPPY